MKHKQPYIPPVTETLQLETAGLLIGPSSSESSDEPKARSFYSDQAQMSRKKGIWANMEDD